MPKYAEEILAAVTELQRHPTAEQVFMEMKKEHPSIAIGTVYKHLNALAEEGLLHRITESGSPDRYDCTERHDHLICSRCGNITDICLRDLTEPIENKLGQKILSYDLRIRYICPACREQEKKATALKEENNELKRIEIAQRADQQGILLRLSVS